MKKSQILAALALAFALGVVAPVVTVNDTYAFTEPSEHHAQGTATPSDVDTVVAAVPEQYPLMGRMVTLNELITNYTADDLATDTIASGATVSKDAKNVVVALNTLNGSAIDATSIWNNASYTDQITAAIAAANKIADYDVVSAIFAAKTDGELQSALRAFNGEFSSTVPTDGNVTIANYDNRVVAVVNGVNKTVKDLVSEAITNVHGAGSSLNYNNYKSAYDATVAAQTNLDKYTTEFNAFKNALTASDVMTSDGWVAYNSYMNNNPNPTIAALCRIATDRGVDGTASSVAFVNDLAGWVSLANMLKGAVKTPYDDNINYRTIIAITTQLKQVAKITDLTEVEIAEDLLKYEGPKADVPTVNPDDVTGEDDKKLPTVGNTGTIAGADATAKATVSIMAAIASVATAAFVAIRKIAAGKKA